MKDPWLLRPPTPDARVRLLCLSHAGAGASTFNPWVPRLAPDLDVCAVQLPGRETRLREPAATRMGPLVDALARGLAPHLDRPYAIFGHSMGATVGFELIRALRRAGAPAPRRLVVAGRRPPHLPTPPPLRHTLPRPAFIAEIQRLGGTPTAVLADPELLDLFAAVLRADFELLETYAWTPGDPLDCPISILHGEADPEVSLDQMKAWSQHTTQDSQVQVFPGDHFFVHQQRAAVLEALRVALTDESR